MYKFEVVIKRDDKELFSFGVLQTELDIADRLGVSMREYIEQVSKIKTKEWEDENLSNSK